MESGVVSHINLLRCISRAPIEKNVVSLHKLQDRIYFSLIWVSMGGAATP